MNKAETPDALAAAEQEESQEMATHKRIRQATADLVEMATERATYFQEKDEFDAAAEESEHADCLLTRYLMIDGRICFERDRIAGVSSGRCEDCGE